MLNYAVILKVKPVATPLAKPRRGYTRFQPYPAGIVNLLAVFFSV